LLSRTKKKKLTHLLLELLELLDRVTDNTNTSRRGATHSAMLSDLLANRAWCTVRVVMTSSHLTTWPLSTHH
jgi:hypothetical protein